MDSIGWLFMTSREDDAPDVARLIGQIAATPMGIVSRGRHGIPDEDPDAWVFGGGNLAFVGEPAAPTDSASRNARGVGRAGLVSLFHRFLRVDAAATQRPR